MKISLRICCCCCFILSHSICYHLSRYNWNRILQRDQIFFAFLSFCNKWNTGKRVVHSYELMLLLAANHVSMLYIWIILDDITIATRAIHCCYCAWSRLRRRQRRRLWRILHFQYSTCNFDFNLLKVENQMKSNSSVVMVMNPCHPQMSEINNSPNGFFLLLFLVLLSFWLSPSFELK